MEKAEAKDVIFSHLAEKKDTYIFCYTQPSERFEVRGRREGIILHFTVLL